MNSGPVAQLRPIEKQVEVLERGVERLDAWPGEHGAHRLDGAADHQRQLDAGLASWRRRTPMAAALTLQRVLAGLEQERVHAALDQGAGLDVVALEHLVEGDVAR